MTTLDQLIPGTRAQIRAVRGPRQAVQRLAEFGVLSGCDIELVRFAPLGDPLTIRVDECLLAVRKEQARLIDVVSTTAESR